MNKQVVIVGLGKYGKSVAKRLSDNGVEVLAIDSDMKVIDSVSDFVTKAICMDVTSEVAWEKLPIKDFDIGIVCFGENISASILTCMSLQDAGVKYIIAKAGDKRHAQVLKKLNIDEIISPEEHMAEITANEILKEKELMKK